MSEASVPSTEPSMFTSAASFCAALKLPGFSLAISAYSVSTSAASLPLTASSPSTSPAVSFVTLSLLLLPEAAAFSAAVAVPNDIELIVRANDKTAAKNFFDLIITPFYEII